MTHKELRENVARGKKALPRCQDCKSWRKINKDNWFGSSSFKDVQMGKCNSEEVKSNPNYYAEYEGAAKDTNVLITYGLQTGANYGCVHHEPKP